MALPTSTANDLANIILLTLPRVQPVTDGFTARWKRDGKRKAPWYAVSTDWHPGVCEQQRHWIGYLLRADEEADAKGKPLPTARQCYSRVKNPQMLTYLAESVGVTPSLIEEGIVAALEDASSMPPMANAFRRIVPWELVEAGLIKAGMPVVLSTV